MKSLKYQDYKNVSKYIYEHCKWEKNRDNINRQNLWCVDPYHKSIKADFEL